MPAALIKRLHRAKAQVLAVISPEARYWGQRFTAMAFAWIACCSPDALIYGYVELGSVPYEVPEGYRFKLTPPWKSKPD